VRHISRGPGAGLDGRPRRDPDVLGDGEAGSRRVGNVCRREVSLFGVKNGSATVLSQHTAMRFRLRRLAFLEVKASDPAQVF
jgi:hypothetical protein